MKGYNISWKNKNQILTLDPLSSPLYFLDFQKNLKFGLSGPNFNIFDQIDWKIDPKEVIKSFHSETTTTTGR